MKNKQLLEFRAALISLASMDLNQKFSYAVARNISYSENATERLLAAKKAIQLSFMKETNKGCKIVELPNGSFSPVPIAKEGDEETEQSETLESTAADLQTATPEEMKKAVNDSNTLLAELLQEDCEDFRTYQINSSLIETPVKPELLVPLLDIVIID